MYCGLSGEIIVTAAAEYRDCEKIKSLLDSERVELIDVRCVICHPTEPLHHQWKLLMDFLELHVIHCIWLYRNISWGGVKWCQLINMLFIPAKCHLENVASVENSFRIVTIPPSFQDNFYKYVWMNFVFSFWCGVTWYLGKVIDDLVKQVEDFDPGSCLISKQQCCFPGRW